MSKSSKVYNGIMALLSFLVVVMIIIELTMTLSGEMTYVFKVVDNSIWIVFSVDYFTRFIISKNKMNFVLNNKIDLISIIPFNSLFKSLRVLRVTRLFNLAKFTRVFRATVFLAKFKRKVDRFLRTNNLNYVIFMTISVILLGALIISLVEGISLGDALWWSFVTTTTVGYGDISPVTPLGRIVAIILMLVGIGFIGMVTGTVATFFLKSNDKKDTSYKKEVLEDIKIKLDNFSDLTKEDINDISNVLISLKENENK